MRIGYTLFVAKIWVISAAEAHFLHTEGVTGSNPVSPTMIIQSRRSCGGILYILLQLSQIYRTLPAPDSVHMEAARGVFFKQNSGKRGQLLQRIDPQD